MSQLPGSLRNATRARVAGGAGDADPTAVDGCGDAVWGLAGRGERRGDQLSAPALSLKAPIIVSATCSTPSADRMPCQCQAPLLQANWITIQAWTGAVIGRVTCEGCGLSAFGQIDLNLRTHDTHAPLPVRYTLHIYDLPDRRAMRPQRSHLRGTIR
jgi:hypothetical protein